MIMIRFTSERWVAADHIAEVFVDSHRRLNARMKTGEIYHVENDHGVGTYDTLDRLIEKINHAVVTVHGAKHELKTS